MRNDWEFWRGFGAGLGAACLSLWAYATLATHRRARRATLWVQAQRARSQLIHTRSHTIHTRPFDWRTDADLKEHSP